MRRGLSCWCITCPSTAAVEMWRLLQAPPLLSGPLPLLLQLPPPLPPLRCRAAAAAAYATCPCRPYLLGAGAVDTVATVGSWQIQPNAVNSGDSVLASAQCACLPCTVSRAPARAMPHAACLMQLPATTRAPCHVHWMDLRRLRHITPPRLHFAVPREAQLEIDVRDIDGPRRDGVLAAIQAEAAAIAARRKVRSCATLL